MSETVRHKKYQPGKHAAARLKLIRELNDMLTVPAMSRLEIVLNYRSRLMALETTSQPRSAQCSEDLRHLIADLATSVAVLEHLSELFENTEEILAFLAEAKIALTHLVHAWRSGTGVETADIDTLDALIELLSDTLKLTRLAEYKEVLLLVQKELSRK